MRPTRFTWETRQGNLDNSENEVKAYFEFDFLSNYDRNSIRLRQFYAQYKNFLAGQAWSAFSDPDAFPDTLEFEGPPGMIAARFPQLRYTHPFNTHNSVGVSIEKSGTDTPFSTQFGVPIGTSKFPDLVGFYRYENKRGHLHAATLFRNVGGMVPNEEVLNLSRHVGGFGESLSGAWGLPFSRIRQPGFSIGLRKGNLETTLQRRLCFWERMSDLTLTWTPGKRPRTGSGQFGYTHNWTKILRSTVSYGYLRINSPAEILERPIKSAITLR